MTAAEARPQSIGDRVRILRLRRGLSQQSLAKVLGLVDGRSWLRQVENNKRGIGLDSVVRLADALETTLDELVRGHLAEERL